MRMKKVILYCTLVWGKTEQLKKRNEEVSRLEKNCGNLLWKTRKDC